jgi:beta-glucosidase
MSAIGGMIPSAWNSYFHSAIDYRLTKFSFSDLKVVDKGAHIHVSLSVTNTGNVAVAEVVQVYVSQHSPSIRRPIKELKGFQKVEVCAVTYKKAELEINKNFATSFWDENRSMWISEKDQYDITVTNGTGQTLKGSIAVEKTSWWKGRG